MPAIPEELLNTCVYLYPDRERAIEGTNFGGSGFLVGIRTSPGAPRHVYVVTNYHVAVSNPEGGQPSPVVRINKLDGSVDAIELDSADYRWLGCRGDVAAARIELDDEVHDFNGIAFENFVSEAQANDILCVGEDVFMVGRFIDLDGGLTNKPAVRFGHVSIAPVQHKKMPNSGTGVSYYCLDMHSRSGFSGSQVWAYRTAGSDLNDAIHGLEPKLHAPILGMLGIHCSQFPEELKISDGKIVTGWSGMTAALPAWYITELLNCREFVKERMAQ